MDHPVRVPVSMVTLPTSQKVERPGFNRQALKRQSRLQRTTFIDTFFYFFLKKIKLYISCEYSARQRIHMKLQAFKFFEK